VYATAKKLAEREGVLRPALIRADDLGEAANAVALVLHGGQVKSVAPTTARQVAVLRLLPVARHLARIGRPHGVAVYRLRFRFRGWNEGSLATADVRWGVDQIRAHHGDVPIVLVGHSMGGRAALLAADAPGVVGVLGLAPWVVPGDAIDQLLGRRLLVLHGPRDRITSAKASRKLVELVRGLVPIRATDQHTEATFIGLRGTGHAMFRRLRAWNALTADFVLHAAVGRPPTEPLADAIRTGFTVR
jgi:dienelactone hydrolase